MKIWENHGGSRCRVWLLHCLLKVAVTQFLLIISKQSMCSTHDVVQVQSATGCFPCSLLEPPSYYMLVPRQTTIDKSHRSSSDALDRIGRGFDGGLNWNNKIQWKVKLRGKSRQVYIYICKITYYLQWTWPKWVVPYRLWRFVHPYYVWK